MRPKHKTTFTAASDREFALSRIFDAPRELVWEVWTNPKHVAQWWGPQGFTTTIEKMEVRPGGVWRHVMHGPDGTDYPNKSKFLEVVKPERIVFVHGGAKKGGPAAHFEATWTFEEVKGGTRVTLRALFKTAAARDLIVKTYGAIEGGKQTLARLGEYLAKTSAPPLRQEVNFIRIFNAPRELVWKAWTEPRRMAQWWGPHGFTNPVCEMDVRIGGALRIVMRAPDGAEHPMTGTFHEVTPPARLVFSMVARDGREHPLLEGLTTAVFTEKNGRTKLVLRSYAVGVAPIAAQMLAGMQAGWSQSLERLTTLVDPA